MSPYPLAAWSAGVFLASCLFSHTVALRLVVLGLGAATCAWIVWRNRGFRALPPVAFAFALWAGWAALSIAWSADPSRSAKEFRNEFIYAAFALWTCYVAAQAPGALRVISAIVAAAAAGACATAIYSYGKGLEAYAHGVHGGPGNHSSMLLTLMPCALVGAWYSRHVALRVGATALAVLFLISAYTTLNRTVWIAFGAELLVMLACLAAMRVRLWGLRNRIAVAVAAALIPAAAIAMTWIVHGERVAGGTPAAFEKDLRIALWPETMELIEQRPLVGYGVGRGMLRNALTKETRDPFAWHAHNIFLDTLLQTGIPGIALLMLLLAMLLREAWRLARNPDQLTAACGMALAGVVVGMLARNMTDVLWVRNNALLFWGVVGMLLGYAQLRNAAPSR